MRNERCSHRELVELQSQKLRRLLRHAYEHVPFYRRRFRQAGVSPGEIHNVSDLIRLPVVEKAELRAQPMEALIDRRIAPSSLIERNTSGSSGQPFRFFMDHAFDAFCKAQCLRPYLTNGRTPFDHVLRLTVTPIGAPRWFQRLGLMREDRIIGNAQAPAMLSAFLDSKPNILQGYPSRLVSLAEAIEREHVGFVAPRLIFSDSELLTNQARDQIERVFGAPLFDVFGTYETDNIGYECAERGGYHLAIDCVVPEIVVNGRAAEPGEPGELVCTVLHNYAMPFIRYKLGDIVASASEPCACGRGLPLLSIIEGRTVDFVRRPDGSKESPMQFLEKFDSIVDFALEYQIVQAAHDRFHVTIVPRRALCAANQDFVVGAIQQQCPYANVTVTAAEHIPREPSGKHRVFRCDVREQTTDRESHRS